jgi:7,8-dihydroneopterin aldolase/epimerase/oxygenase
MTDRITLGGMQFVGRHGVTEKERAEARPFEVDLLVRLDLSTPARTDDLADTVDYGALFKLTREVVEGPSFHLLEGLAGAIADAVLAAHPVDDVEVRVRKPKAPLPGAFDIAEVRIRRRSG